MDKRVYVHTALNNVSERRVILKKTLQKKNPYTHPVTPLKQKTYPELSNCSDSFLPLVSLHMSSPGGEVRLGCLFCLRYDVVSPHFESVPEKVNSIKLNESASVGVRGLADLRAR